MSEGYEEEDSEGLPDPTDRGADDPGAGDSDGPADPWAPLDTSSPQEEPPTDRNEILTLVNWCRDLEKQLLELRALINQSSDSLTGSHDNPKVLGSNIEGTETTLSDTWNVAVDLVPVDVWQVTRVVYNHAGSKILYKFMRKFSYDSIGALYAVSGETKVEIDAASNQ